MDLPRLARGKLTLHKERLDLGRLIRTCAEDRRRTLESAGLSLVLGTQELADLRMPARERALEQVIGNLTVLIAHRQVLPESCALIAGLAGTRGAWRTSRHSGGRTTRTRTTEPNLGAERLMGLAPGVAAVTVLTRSAGARIVRIFSGAGADA